MPRIHHGTHCRTLDELDTLLGGWIKDTNEQTISDHTDSRTGYVTVTIDGVACAVAGDTRRDGVEESISIWYRTPTGCLSSLPF